MAEGLVLGLIAATSFLLGWLIIWQFGPPHKLIPGGWLPVIFTSQVLGIMVIGWLGLVLAEFGIFSASRLAPIWLLLCVALFLLARRRSQMQTPILEIDETTSRFKVLPGWWEYLFLGLWLVVAIWLFFRPHEYIIGGADASVYVNLGTNIARDDGILIQDETLANLDEALYPALLRPIPPGQTAGQAAPYYLFPGFFVPGSPAGRIIPQFYHLHPVWQAVAYDLGQPVDAGLEAALLLTGLWALLASLAVYLLVRQIAGWETAAVALTALSLTGLQVWFARYPTTEMLTQLLIWTGLYALAIWLGPAGGWSRQPARPAAVRFWGLLAGLALGQVYLVRIDTYLLLVVPAGLWLALHWSGRWCRHHWYFFLPLAGLTLHSIVHAFWQSRPYLYSVFGAMLRLAEKSWVLLLAAGAGLILLLAAGHFRHYLGRLARFRQTATWLAISAVILLALYGWFVRPQLGGADGVYTDWYGGGAIPRFLDLENLVRLGWYLSPLGIALATTGICLLIWNVDRQTGPLLAVGLLFSLFYLWRVQANPHQVYVMRRYMPVVVPFAVVAGAYALYRLAWYKSNWSRAAAVGLAVVWLAALGWLARGFVSQVDYQGIISQMDAFNVQLNDQSVLIFNDQAAVTTGDFLGTPLQFIYDHRAYSLRDLDALDTSSLHGAIGAWQQAGRTVYWVGDPAGLAELELKGAKPFSTTISAQILEGTYDHKPTQLLPITWNLLVTPVQPLGR